MSDREALAAAVEALDREQVNDSLEYELVLFAAARERFAQLPEKCGTCGGSGTIDLPGSVDSARPPRSYADLSGIGVVCSTCDGSGKVYPAETVERIASVFFATGWGLMSDARARAVAVLDALNGIKESDTE